MRDTQQYVFEGVRYPSPSEMNDHLGFGGGIERIPPHILEAAAARGTRVHDWCESFLLGDPLPVPEAYDEELRCSAFMDWMDETTPDVRGAENVVVSHEHRIAGKLDILTADEDGKLQIVDIKTGSSTKLYAGYYTQQAFYSIAVKEQYDLDYYPRRFILQLPKNGSYKLRPLDNDEDYDVAKAMAKVMWRLIDEKLVRLD